MDGSIHRNSTELKLPVTYFIVFAKTLIGATQKALKELLSVFFNFFFSASLHEHEVLKTFPKFRCAGLGMGFGQHLCGGCLGGQLAGAWV